MALSETRVIFEFIIALLRNLDSLQRCPYMGKVSLQVDARNEKESISIQSLTLVADCPETVS